MISNNYSSVNQPNFTSTFIPRSAKLAKMTFGDATGNLDRFFDIKGFCNKSVKSMRDEINLGQAGMNFDKRGITIVGKDREADEFISRIVKKKNNAAEYTQDTPETIFEGPIFEVFG